MAFKFKEELRMRITATRLQLLLCSAVCLALCLVLPFLTGQIPQIGNTLSPMHIPVLLCAFLCGPWYAAIIGAIAPLLRFMLFGMPPLFPTGVAMCFELFTYGAVAGIMYRLLPRKALHVYVSLITAMIAGRIVWGGCALYPGRAKQRLVPLVSLHQRRRAQCRARHHRAHCAHSCARICA